MLAAMDLARQAGDSEARYWRSWFDAVGGIPGDPYGIEVRSFDGVTAILCEAIPRSDYNRVLQLCDHQAGHLHDIARFYHQRQTPFRVDVSPEWCSGKVLGELDGMGFRPSDFQTVLVVRPGARRRRPLGDVLVREVMPDELDDFASVYEEAYYGIGQPKRLQDFRAASVRARFHSPGWRFYVAMVDGQPVGGGGLHVAGDTATLAGGATLGSMRGRGCQSALLQRRLEDAADLGCRFVFGRCHAGSVSQRNMEKAGLRPLFTKLIWEHRWRSDPRQDPPRRDVLEGVSA